MLQHKKSKIFLFSLLFGIILSYAQQTKARSGSDEIIRVAKDLPIIETFLRSVFFLGYMVVEGGEGTLDYLDIREKGDPLLTVFRIETNQQQLNSNQYATDMQAEAGYGLFSVSFRQTQYSGKVSADKQQNVREVSQYYGHYRMMSMESTQIDIAVGTLTLDGDEHHSGTALSLPVSHMINKNFGLHFRPAWAHINRSHISDYNLAASYHHKHLTIKLGYRWFRNNSHQLKGPTLGLQYSY